MKTKYSIVERSNTVLDTLMQTGLINARLLLFSETLGHVKRNENERVYILENACKRRKKGERIVISIPEKYKEIQETIIYASATIQSIEERVQMPVHTFDA